MTLDQGGSAESADSESARRRWLARAAFVAAFASVAVLVVFAGLHTLTLLIVAVGAVVVAVAALFWFLTSRGVLRWLSLVVLVLTPIVVLGLLIGAQLLWVVLLAAGLAVLAVVCARAALGRDRADWLMPEHPSAPPERPFLVMNPHSGGGKVGKFDLKKRAEELGAEVVLLEGPGTVDVEALARDAVARGADLLGVAGGDGTQALVAGIAAEHDLPFLVISAGTRNHFALDLGLDRDDPARCLDALSDGIELRIDLGKVGGRTFVNNASFGAYAEVVQSPAYRDDKTGTILRMLPDLLAGQRGGRLLARFDDRTIDGPQAVLVSNGPYEMQDLAGLGRRPRIDRGTLGVVTISVSSTRQAVGLLHRARQNGLIQHSAREVVIDADAPEIPAGIDGEALVIPTPVRCTVTPGALRVRVPRNRPGVRPPARPVDWVRLRRLAVGTRRRVGES
ncbi:MULTISPECIES: diacylglycerol kinase family protein [unclassified Rhodococcus (in: high G+C Gram-positive bacteria)]|uniref:diacylglycerol/lipid kinase family protein n=1 Tax=unclassified Rhodococcus (in: high G+C Gram-positive bacteria) TaxID=192944 RepID=UPI00163AFA13|nr:MULTISPECIES: diacylglycerol kinase family protein [unclassified Rhodococcus (in: high G+C Gram-positive bacteria)]MBC2639902.1 NAD(+)/NADH kinase [Rhodococcus sp. 3A]MBC2895351.1 NAD(+)/NADH kinase [Rhodococcus sp. 4CII]